MQVCAGATYIQVAILQHILDFLLSVRTNKYNFFRIRIQIKSQDFEVL